MEIQQNKDITVLVTGATGFLAGHIIQQLLEKNYKVKGTVRQKKSQIILQTFNNVILKRSLEKKEKYEHLLSLKNASENLELVEATLENLEIWDTIVKNCTYIIHVASPCPSEPPKNENDLILPATQGTEAIMNAAIKNNVKKIVLTSSESSVESGNLKQNFFTEKDWQTPEKSAAYDKSKYYAEKKAWEIYEKNKSDSLKNNNNNTNYLQLTAMLPGFLIGPCLSKNYYASGEIITKIMKYEIPAIPKLSLAHVDVRDAAFAHISAMEKNISNGKRYIISEGSYWLEDTVAILKEEFQQYGYKFPSFKIGKILFNIAAIFDKQMQMVKHMEGRMILFDNTLSRKELDVFYRNHRQTLIESAYDFINKGFVPNKLKNQKK
ncbi:hypothetical protein PPERSA_00569 [Pseudocohnilembus persalinus]|uniref:NAD-dependent epimerase/dehydratase domain-containing protein n=1 Tax=Pseudocohnilembus persalinus TaxID=266149 RepID=A0A0V0QSR1_PSEPJ|nr:hypothetical protein PPERSA_00569 [Pseudocohnilembus persalinus]|eukprot:KRX05268.1 hypothetical protein PPERSA_00569 [Pseudocohnilembus persalinus]